MLKYKFKSLLKVKYKIIFDMNLRFLHGRLRYAFVEFVNYIEVIFPLIKITRKASIISVLIRITIFFNAEIVVLIIYFYSLNNLK